MIMFDLHHQWFIAQHVSLHIILPEARVIHTCVVLDISSTNKDWPVPNMEIYFHKRQGPERCYCDIQ